MSAAPRHMASTAAVGQSMRGDWLLPILCVVVACPFVFASTLYYHLPLSCAPLFLLMEAGGTICIGRLLLRLLGMDCELPSAADLLALSHLLGYGASLLLYVVLFLLAPHAVIGTAYLVLSALALVACAALAFSDGWPASSDTTRMTTLVLFFVLLVVYTFTFMLPNFLPITQTNSYYLDNVFWVGNNVELTYAIPPDNFRNVLASDIRYHYLSSIRMALVQTTLCIPAFEACFAYSFVDLAFMLASAATMFVRELSDDSEDGLPYSLTVFLLLFSTGAERLTSMSFLSHLYVASFGFGESFAYMLAYLVLAKRYWQRGTVRLGETLASALMLALCMGNKGTLGFVCLVVTFVLCVTSLFSRERRGFALGFGLTVLAAGLVVYFGILSEGIWRNVGDVSNVRSMLSFPRVRVAYEWMRSLPLPRVLQEGLFLGFYAFASHPILYGLALVAFVQGVMRRDFDALDIALLVATATCLFILRLVDMRGFSQSYFYMATVPLLWGYVIRRLQVAARYMTRVAAVGAGLAAAALSLTLCYQLWIPKLAARSVLHLAGAEMPESLAIMGGFNDNVVTPEAYDALVWVRENLPTDALYMTDIYDTASSSAYYPGSMSQRHVIMQKSLCGYLGVDYNDDVLSVFEGGAEALGQYREVGIGYLIQLTSSEALEALFPESLEVVYRQGGASVYRLS